MRRMEAAALRRASASRSPATGAMGKTDQTPPGDTGNPIGEPIGKPGAEDGDADRAFDLWLRRGLHQLYDTVTKEPVPDALLRLIEDDRAARKK